MGRHANDQSDTRQEIKRATSRALCKHGSARLTVQDIADAFDKSKSLSHYHSDTKDDLLVAVLDHIVGWIGARLDESSTENPLERRTEFVDWFVIALDDDRRGFALALFELRLQAVHNEVFRATLAQHYAENAATVAEIMG